VVDIPKRSRVLTKTFAQFKYSVLYVGTVVHLISIKGARPLNIINFY